MPFTPDYQTNTTSLHNDESDINIKQFLMTLWRRKFLILIVMLLGVGSMFLYVQTLSPKYSAKASVLIENGLNPSGELRSFISSIRIDSSVILSEAEVLKSRTMARKVIGKLGLMNDPEYNPRLRMAEPNAIDKIINGDVRENNFKTLSVNRSAIEQGAEDPELGLVIDVFLEHMRVRPVPGSFVLQVEFNSQNPQKAALVANTIIDEYIDLNLDKKFRVTERLTNWLDTRLNTLRIQAREAEDALEAFRLENNLQVNDIEDFTQQQLNGLSAQLVKAKAQEAEAQARLKQIENPSKIMLTPEAENSRVLQALKLKEAQTLDDIAELSDRYGPKYPAMIDADLALKEVRSQMRQETKNIAKNIEANLKFAQARVSEIEDSLNQMDQPEGSDINASIRLRELERELDASRSILEAFLQTYKRAADQGKLQESQASVISYATIPLMPYHPNKPLFLSLSVIVSFFIGVGLVLLLENMATLFRTVEELEEETGHACLGLIPAVPKLDPKKPIADYVISRDGARVAESMRTLRMVLNLRAENKGQKAKVVTLTSSLPEEGKTTLSTWMARVSAKSGERVIVIDCDLRRPRLHTAFGKTPQNTLVEYLTGKCTLEEALYRDPATNTHVIFGRSVPNNALDLISKDRMSNLIEALREQYDLVILDSPACLSVSDARLLASKSDQTVYVVSWNESPREVVNAGLKQFADFGYDAVTLVLNNVDLKRYAKYGFNDAVHYYSAYNPYYQD